MRNPKNRNPHGFGVELEVGTPKKTKTVASNQSKSNEPNEYLEKRRKDYMKAKEMRENKGLIDMNSLLK